MARIWARICWVVTGIWVVMQTMGVILGIIVDGREVFEPYIQRLSLPSIDDCLRAYTTVKWLVALYVGPMFVVWPFETNNPRLKRLSLLPKLTSIVFIGLTFASALWFSHQMDSSDKGQIFAALAGLLFYLHHMLLIHHVDVLARPNTVEKVVDANFEKAAKLPIATAADFQSKSIDRKAVRICDVPRRTDVFSVIDGYTFTNCQIVGPAIIAPLLGCQFRRNSFRLQGGLHSDAQFWPRGLTLGQWGTIQLANTTFDSCEFSFIGIAGDESTLLQFKRDIS